MILTNYYKPEKYYQVRDNFYLSYSIPTSKAKRIILSVLESENLNLTSPDVSIHITNIDTRGVNYSLTYYCTDLFLERIMRTKILTKIIDTLKESNIEPTYQKVDLITKNERNNDYSIDKSQFLKQIELFKTLDEDLLFLLSSKLEESFYKENTVIIEEGDIESTSLFIIVEGLLTVNIKDKTTGNNIQISKLESRNYFGEFSLLTDKPRSATVISKTDVILFEIKKEDIFDILHNNPSLLEYLSEILTNRQLGIKNSIELLNKKMLNEQKNMKETILNRMKKVFNY
jgi:CRP-like cAMP-binding protein